ncbi:MULTISPECIES: hypothetical protein [Comamonas]|uniref:hypothetical protein n=1 Tax=Comamonas TaxID=283 RepID=UPI0015FCFD69|nr:MULTISPECIES: hypothetical protein [Comamonas]UUC95994.1 hypothetical protein NOX35_12190 [Comamonas sp. C11]WEE80226.1 hypothetical protein LZ683_13155 [Comamonas testosteroni]
MKIQQSSDTSGLTLVSLISEELESVFEKIEKKYSKCNIEMFFVFRCLPDEYKRASSLRFVKKDNTLYCDITVSEDKYQTLSKDWQRFYLSHYFYDFFCTKFKKYKFENLDVKDFLANMNLWLKEIGWLKEEVEVYVDEYEVPR